VPELERVPVLELVSSSGTNGLHLGKSESYTPLKLEQLFPRISISLTKLSIVKRALVLHSFLLLLLSSEHYTAASRVFLLYLVSSLKLGLRYLREDEEKTAKGLLEVAK